MKNSVILKYFVFFLGVLLPTITGAESHEKAVIRNLPQVSSTSSDAQKVVIGEVENVTLVPGAVTLPARIDTGAALSSLDARDVSVRNGVATFTMGKKYGGMKLRFPVVEWATIRSSVGVEKRPVVQIGICLGRKLLHTLVTLKDRSGMVYPFLVGRNVLSGNFVVDTSRVKALTPGACLTPGSLAMGTGDLSIH